MPRRSLPITVLVSFGAALLFVVGLHSYQYFRLRHGLAPILIQEAGRQHREEINRFFTQVTSTLTMIRDWGKNGTLTRQDPVGLNKKFFPLLENQPAIRSLILADDQGWEYYLYRQEPYWISRSRQPGSDTLTWNQWQHPDEAVKSWKKPSSYDPRQRPWYKEAIRSEAISWTAVYTFYQSGEQGFTCSLSWQDSTRMVCGLDIPIRQIRELLQTSQQGQPYALFLVKDQGGEFIGGRQDPEADHLIQEAIANWQQQGGAAEQTLSLQRDKTAWQILFTPVGPKDLSFWLAVAAPAGSMGTSLARDLFRFSPREILLALAGGLLLFLFLWLTGRGSERQHSPSPLALLEQTINGGESSRSEFKSTIRTNLKTGKPGKEIELAWLKAVVAFLNSRGGILLLGVADDGTVLGLEQDGFSSDDRCLLHIKNLLNQHLGPEFFRFIRIDLVETATGKVVMIQCQPAGKPVFLRIGKNEEFYIRSGPSSTKLSPSQIVNYLQKQRT